MKKDNKQADQMISREIDTIAIDKADEVHTEANTKRNQAVRPVIIEYSQWQEKLLVKDAKNNELGLRFTVTNTLKIRDELIDQWYYLNEWNKGYYVNGIFKSENKIMKVIVFKQAEEKRLELIQLKKLGPEFSEKSPKAIYTGSSLNSKQTTNSSPTISSSIKHEYITKEFELDININNIHQSSFTQSRSKNFSSSLSQLTSTVIANSLRKRNIEELKVDPQKNRKNIKTNS
ncbi:4248_t:CDS:2 [Rhizophagus irregularis]|nr:4248_t:CDS:2 [Rhizophagus irregularis]